MNTQRRHFESDVSKQSARGRLPSGEPNPVDAHVGRRLRLRRTLLGISQEELGKAVGLTFQQVQKYEHGANRIGASRLWEISRALGCSVSYFYESISEDAAGASPRNLSRPDLEMSFCAERGQINEFTCSRETLELVRAYNSIKEARVRTYIYNLANSLGSKDEKNRSA